MLMPRGSLRISTFGKKVCAAHSLTVALVLMALARVAGGYSRAIVNVAACDGSPPVRALLYTATTANPNFIAAPITDPAAAAAIIARAHGPSGPNRIYLEKLAHWLTCVGETDAHIEQLMQSLPPAPPPPP